MSSKIFTILGSTGNIGYELSRVLRASGHTVRAVVRSKDSTKAQQLEKLGAELWLVVPKEEAGKTLTTDVPALTAALTGADGAFIMVPPNLHAENPQNDAKQFIASVRSAVEASKIAHVVLLSSMGAQVQPLIGGLQTLNELEAGFETLTTVRKTILRPSYFYWNVLGNLSTISTNGYFAHYITPDIKVSVVDTDDIAEQAALELESPPTETNSKLVELEGPEQLTFEQITDIIGEIVERPIVYIHLPSEKQERIWLSIGCSPQGAIDMKGLYDAISTSRTVWEHPEKVVRRNRTFKEYLTNILKEKK